MLGIKFASALFFPSPTCRKEVSVNYRSEPHIWTNKKDGSTSVVSQAYLGEGKRSDLPLNIQSGQNTIQYKFIFSNEVMLLNVRDVGNPKPNFLLSPLSNFVLVQEN